MKNLKQKIIVIKNTFSYGLRTMGYGLILLSGFTVKAQTMISYSTIAQQCNVGTALTPLTATVSGGTVGVNGQTYTIAGTATFNNSFNRPSGAVADAVGNVYIADAGNNMIRKYSISGGTVSTFAGSGTAGSANGTGTAASFNNPTGVSIDASGNIYVADKGNDLIRKISPAGAVTTLAGTAGTAGNTNGTGTAASFNAPCGVAADGSGNLYVADYGNNLIRKIVISTAAVTTLAGSGTAGSANGTGTAASFNQPKGVATDATGNIYIADQANNLVRKVTPAAVVTTYASGFSSPSSVTVDGSGVVYVANTGSNEIFYITTTGTVNVLSGMPTAGSADGPIGTAQFTSPVGVAADNFGNVFVCDGDYVIRRVVYSTFVISPYLSAGLSFNLSNGTISGTPTEALAATKFTVTAYSGSFSASTSIMIGVAGTPVIGPTPTNNYVITNEPRLSGFTTDSTIMVAANQYVKMKTSIQYADGLGRPVQMVEEQASGNLYDLVTPMVYDQYGREVSKYLVYAAETGLPPGTFKPTAISDQNTFYGSPPTGSGVTTITDPYGQTAFDNSPLNRPVEQGFPGVPWQLTGSGTGTGHTMKMVYTINNATSFAADSINGRQAAMYYSTILSNFGQRLHANGYYPAGTLTVTVSKDENWVSGRAGTVEEYKDIDGHVVLKRVYNYTGGAVQMLSTYYIYDDLGRLAYVLPPASGADGAGTISEAILINLCYQYQYDERGRPVQKRIPGKGWEYTVYNVMDQPVATQDSLQRNNNQWIFTKYDGLGRVVVTGIWNNGGTAITGPALQTILDGITTNLYEASVSTGNGYTNVAWPTTNVTTTLGINYYDGYANMPGMPTAYTAPTGADLATRGELTGTQTNVLGSTDMLWTAHYYDYFGRSLTSYAQHYLGGSLNASNYDAVSSTYFFSNKPATITRKHWTSGSTTYPKVTVYNRYTYNQWDRKINTYEQLTNGNGTPDALWVISTLNYNEIGQLRAKKLHSADSTNYAQAYSFGYNERGWLQTASSPLFAMTLYYNTAASNKAYNGNIMYQYWGVPGNLNNHYTYTYDKLNRLLGGVTSLDNYQESGIAYDPEGNITALNRYQAGAQIDQLGYIYNTYSNQLASVTDLNASNSGLVSGTTSYTWDGNGNLLSSANTVNTQQNKSFTYNLLNLPNVVTVPNGTDTYTYDATGNKLRRVAVISGTTTTTDYIDGIEYDNSTTAIGFIQTEEGKAVPNGATAYDYNYYLGDNLGNTRITFGTKTGSAVVYQKDDYYPFGLEINRTNYTPKNEYLYNKKELQEDFTEYDYGARFYDPVIGRFNTIDRFAEKYKTYSSYIYTLDNPLRYIDVHGDSVKVTNALKYDKDNKTNIVNSIISDLQSETGLTITIDQNGQMQYAKDKDGNATISKDDKGNMIGSAKARDIFTSAIGNDKTANLNIGGNKSSSTIGGLEINISAKQVDNFIAGANKVDSKTMGYGMTFLHETLHSEVGGSLTDSGFGKIGAVETIMNSVRSQLNQNGGNFGQRLSYRGLSGDSGTAFIPFDTNSLNAVKTGNEPSADDKYVSYPNP